MEWKVVSHNPNGDPWTWVLVGQDAALVRATVCGCPDKHFKLYIQGGCCMDTSVKHIDESLPEFLETLKEPALAFVEAGHCGMNRCYDCGEDTGDSGTRLFTHFRQKHGPGTGSTVKSAMKA